MGKIKSVIDKRHPVDQITRILHNQIITIKNYCYFLKMAGIIMQYLKKLNFGLILFTVGSLLMMVSTHQRLAVASSTTRPATVVISDSEFNLTDWSVEERSDYGASHTFQQETSGGNPGAYLQMHHILPPEASQNLGFIEVTYLYEAQSYDPATQGAIDHIEYAEDLIFMTDVDMHRKSYPVIVQDGQTFICQIYVGRLFLDPNTWESFSIQTLWADHFISDDGNNNHPDFSNSGKEMHFGFWRSSRVAWQSTGTVDFVHGIDNFNVTIFPSQLPPDNQAPVAIDDTVMVDPNNFGPYDRIDIFPLGNDYDPDGDSLIIVQTTDAVHGGVEWHPDFIAYFIGESVVSDSFEYQITDGGLRDWATIRIQISTNVKENESLNPASAILEQNFPNPFNGSTQIRYQLHETVPVHLSIYNIQGQAVRTLVYEKQLPGDYKVDWDGKDESGKRVPSQIYICQLMAGGYMEVKKMLLIQ